jgi:hypothetical protein
LRHPGGQRRCTPRLVGRLAHAEITDQRQHLHGGAGGDHRRRVHDGGEGEEEGKSGWRREASRHCSGKRETPAINSSVNGQAGGERPQSQRLIVTADRGRSIDRYRGRKGVPILASLHTPRHTFLFEQENTMKSSSTRFSLKTGLGMLAIAAAFTGSNAMAADATESPPS